MALTLTLDALEDLPRTPASAVKKLGWRGVMKTLGRQGKVLVTNHNAPEAVILSAEEYGAILQALQQAGARNATALDALRQRFDARLSCLQADEAGARLREVIHRPAALGGEVKADASR